MKVISLISSVVIFSGCATVQTPREPVSVTINTKKSKDDSIKSVTQAFAMNGFQIRSIDKDSGLITADAKQFGIPRGILGVVHEGRARVQVLTLDHAVQLQILSECRYSGVNATSFTGGMTALSSYDAGYSSCIQGDQDANKVLPENDWKIQNIVRAALGEPALDPLPPPLKPKMDPNAKAQGNPFKTSGS